MVSNIIKFDSRPFFSVEEMNKTMIENWNNKVHKLDEVIILGDFCWGKEDEWIEILSQLKGVKTLIKGNHDLKQMSTKCRKLFSDVKDYKEINDNGRKVILCHYPILCYKSSYNPNNYMLHGHVHTTKEHDYTMQWITELRKNKLIPIDNCGQVFNCWCGFYNYTPVTLDEIITFWEQKERVNK